MHSGVQSSYRPRLLLRLYECWLFRTHRAAFDDARRWREANSLRIGDLLSSGVCDVCDCFDTPSELLLCAEPNCARAMHRFCCAQDAPPSEDDWRCPEHTEL